MAYLVLMDGPDKGLRYELPEGELSLGRSEKNDIRIEGSAVSGQHCTITIDANGVTLRDGGSTNGTRVNDEVVAEAALFRGDIITLGTTPVMIEGSDVPARDGDAAVGDAIERTRVDIRPRTTRSRSPVQRPSDFGKRRDHNKQWKALILIIGVAVAFALVLFIRTFFTTST